MQKIKLLLIGFLGLMILFTVIGLVTPSTVKISRGVIVDADSAKVIAMISDVHTWPEWMVWLSSEQGSLVKFKTDGKGSSVKWHTLEQKSSGEILLLNFNEDIIHLQHQFPGMNSADGGIRVRSVNPSQTEILWMIEYPLKWYPWERFEGIFMDAMIGQSLEQSLKLLEEKLKVVSMKAV